MTRAQKVEGWENLHYVIQGQYYKFTATVTYRHSGLLKTLLLVADYLSTRSQVFRLVLVPIIYIYRRWTSATGRIEPKPREDILLSEDVRRLVTVVNTITNEDDYMKLFEGGLALALAILRQLNETEVNEVNAMADLILRFIRGEISEAEFARAFGSVSALRRVDATTPEVDGDSEEDVGSDGRAGIHWLLAESLRRAMGRD